MRTRPLRITVSPVRFEEEDLRDNAQHLTYRRRGKHRIYDLPCEQHGTVIAMRLQIVLEENELNLIRARYVRLRFYEQTPMLAAFSCSRGRLTSRSTNKLRFNRLHLPESIDYECPTWQVEQLCISSYMVQDHNV